jgi:hypothetical protein
MIGAKLWGARKPRPRPAPETIARWNAFGHLATTREGQILLAWLESTQIEHFMEYKACKPDDGFTKARIDGKVEFADRLRNELLGADEKLIKANQKGVANARES